MQLVLQLESVLIMHVNLNNKNKLLYLIKKNIIS